MLPAIAALVRQWSGCYTGGMDTCEIRILGPFGVAVNGTERRIVSRKCRSLLAELALRRGQPVEREDLIARLWPESSDARARDSLRHALWRLRVELGPAGPVLHSHGGLITLDHAVDVDAQRFEQLVASERSADLELALSLYRGDLCRELDSPESEAERERLRLLLLLAGTRLVDEYLTTDDGAAAARTARFVLQYDPYREETHRQLLVALAATGDRAAMSAHYRWLTELLDRELGVAPSAETRSLYVRLRHGERQATTGLAVRRPSIEPPAGLTGRRDEYRRLVEALGDAIDGHARIVSIVGAAGVGKTRLLEEIGLTAAEHGLRVLSGRGVGAEGRLDYQIWVEALRPVEVEAGELPSPWPVVLAALLPALLPTAGAAPGSVAPRFARARLFEGVAVLLGRLARQSPVTIILDDVHWADADALQLLHYLARTMPDARILFVIAARPVEHVGGSRTALTETWTQLRSTGRFTEIELGPLRPESVAEFLARTGVTAGTVQWLAPRMAAWTGGNPFFLLEATRALVEQAVLRRNASDELEWAGPPLAGAEPLLLHLPRGVRETVLSRGALLPEQTRHLLNDAAVIGKVFLPEVLAAVSGHEEVTAVRALMPALRADLLRDEVQEGRPALAFRHDLVREAHYQQQPVVLRAATHRRVATVLEGRGIVGAAVAHHLLVAGELERAIEHLLVAARTSEASFAHEEALRAYSAALAAMHEGDVERRASVLEAIGRVHLHRGKVAEAVEAHDRALALLTGGAAIEARARHWTRIALACGQHYGQHPRALEFAAAAVDHYAARGASAELTEALLGLAYMQYQTLDASEAETTGRRALALSRQLDLPRQEAAALHLVTWVRYLVGDVCFAPEQAAIERLTARLGAGDDIAQLLCTVAMSESRRGLFENARLTARAAVEAARRVGSSRTELLALENIARPHLVTGNWDGAVAAAEHALKITARLGDGTSGIDNGPLQVLALAHAARGNTDEALAIARRLASRDVPEPDSTPAIHRNAQMLAAETLLLLGRGDLLPAPELFVAGRPLCKSCACPWLIAAGQYLALGGAPDAALALARELEARVRETGALAYLGWVHVIRALVHRGCGQATRARREADEARRQFGAIGHELGLTAVKLAGL